MEGFRFRLIAGFVNRDNSWEPATNMVEDVPVAFKSCITKHIKQEQFTTMTSELGIAA
jgi:hypothetical protein